MYTYEEGRGGNIANESSRNQTMFENYIRSQSQPLIEIE